jgi:hypothetical protein
MGGWERGFVPFPCTRKPSRAVSSAVPAALRGQFGTSLQPCDGCPFQLRSCHSRRPSLDKLQQRGQGPVEACDRAEHWAADMRVDATMLRRAFADALDVGAMAPPISDTLQADYLEALFLLERACFGAITNRNRPEAVFWSGICPRRASRRGPGERARPPWPCPACTPTLGGTPEAPARRAIAPGPGSWSNSGGALFARTRKAARVAPGVGGPLP